MIEYVVDKIRPLMIKAEVVGAYGDFTEKFDIKGRTATEILEQFNKIVDREKGTGWEYFLPRGVYELAENEAIL